MPDRDALFRFTFDRMPVRGAVVRLTDAWAEIRSRNDMPSAILPLLGEAVAATTLMMSGVKVRGQVELQLKGGSPLRLLLAHCTSERQIRGIIDGDEDELREPVAFRRLVENANLAITIEQEETGRRYQGIVPLTGDSLSESLEGYFRQSEQLPTRLWLAAGGQNAAGLLLQRLPGEAEDEDGWNRVIALAETLSGEELLSLDGLEVLRRLFHREQIAIEKPETFTFGCRCSRERVVQVLQSLGEAEIGRATDADGSLEVNCEFCNEKYAFDAIDLAHLFRGVAAGDGSETRQ